MELVVLAGCVMFGGIALIGTVWLLGVIFSESILWGLASLFIPGASLLFVVTHWDQSKRAFGAHALGAIGLIVTLVVGSAAMPGLRRGTGRPSASASASAATRQVNPCPSATPATDGFSRWCCSPEAWTKVGEGEDCTSTPAPTEACDAEHLGAMTTEACSTLGVRKRRR